MVSKQPQITEQTKRSLKDAFWSLYVEKPIAKISIKEITDRAGYNRGTFYLYYKDVYDILDAIEQELLDKMEALVKRLLEKDDVPDIEGNMKFILELASEYERDRTAVLIGENGDAQFKMRFKRILWPLVASWMRASEFQNETEERLIRQFCLSGLLAAIASWLDDDGGMPLDEFIHLIMSAMLPPATPSECLPPATTSEGATGTMPSAF